MLRARYRISKRVACPAPAPEAGSQRMRNVINKGLTEEVILDGAGKAFEAAGIK